MRRLWARIRYGAYVRYDRWTGGLVIHSRRRLSQADVDAIRRLLRD